MIGAEAVGVPRARDRLTPRLARGRLRSRAMFWSLGAAVALHLLLAGVLLRPPAFLRGARIEAPLPRMAEVEMVENNMGAASDAAVGGDQRVSHGAPDAPPPKPRSGGQPPPDSPDAPVAKDGELPPPGPGAVSTLPPTPGPQAQPQPQDQDTMARVTLNDDGTEGEESGGSAMEPAQPDPKVHNKLPRYPVAAARAGQSGEVDMVVSVQPDGTAGEVVVANSSGSAPLDEAAVRAVRTWKFHPARDHGQPVVSDVPVRLNFVLNGG